MAQSALDKLGFMKDAVTEQVENLEGSVAQVEEQIVSFEDDIEGVEDALCAVAESDLADYLDTTKLAEIQALWPAVPLVLGPVYIVYGGTYGTIDYTTGNITDWEFRQDNLVIIFPAPAPVPPYYVRYQYLGIGWDGDTTITDFVNDFAFGNDYLTRPLDSGATYGLYANKDALSSAKGILETNTVKVDASEAIFVRYT